MKSPFILLLSACFLLHLSWGYQTDRVLLRDVTSLVLSDSKMTTGRRNNPIPQLKCTGGPCHLAPKRVMCKQSGWDGRDVTWKCEGDLEGVKFGNMDVVCEGYGYPDDPYILAGSCGLEYTLERVGGSTGSRSTSSSYTKGSSYSSYQPSSSVTRSSSWGWMFWLAVLAGVGYFMYQCLKQGVRGVSRGVSRRFGNWGQWGNPGNWGRWAGYGAAAPGGPNPPPYDDLYYGGKVHSQAAPVSSGPGFWSGLLGGAGLGYLFRGRQQQNAYAGYGAQPYVNQNQYGGGYVNNNQAGHSQSPRAPPAGPAYGYAETRRR